MTTDFETYTIEIFKTGRGYEAKVIFNDGFVGYPDIISENEKMLIKYIDDYIYEIYEQATDPQNDNYSTLFYIAGYNGNLQTEYKLKALKDGVYMS